MMGRDPGRRKSRQSEAERWAAFSPTVRPCTLLMSCGCDRISFFPFVLHYELDLMSGDKRPKWAFRRAWVGMMRLVCTVDKSISLQHRHEFGANLLATHWVTAVQIFPQKQRNHLIAVGLFAQKKKQTLWKLNHIYGAELHRLIMGLTLNYMTLTKWSDS